MVKRQAHILPLLFLPLLFLLLFLVACAALQTLSSQTQVSPQISTGKKIPDVNLLDTQGNSTELYPLLQRAKRTALIFYRGYW